MPTRDTTVKLRCDEREKASWVNTATQAGQSLSDWLRRVANDQAQREAPTPTPKATSLSSTSATPVPITPTDDTLSEQEVRERIRLRELRQSAPSRPFRGPDLKDKWKSDKEKS